VNATIDSYFDWIAADKRAVIPNPVDVAELQASAPAPAWPWPHAILAMGRLAPEKGFDLLIEAFAQVAPRFADWGLAILGEGRLRRELESSVVALGLNGRVILPGAIRSPGSALGKADLFVLSSRWEALPMALIEAMVCGVPAIATQSVASADEWLRGGHNVVLVPTEDAPALAVALADLMVDPAQRRLLGQNASHSKRQFDVERILDLWEGLLRKEK
jgi:GalNAc-alpha-(1->4)-GalNAc-alpha-(1->3)-diNAcBac-PP-undecaprenol alpha-1,4-N-acetyl-D-galactosaminyltransferase